MTALPATTAVVCAGGATWRSWQSSNISSGRASDDYAVMDRGAIVLSGTRAEMNETEVRRRLTV